MYILIACITALVLFALVIYKNDIMHPCFIICAMFLASSLSALYNVDVWGIELGSTTIELIVASLLALIIGGAIAQVIPFPRITLNSTGNAWVRRQDRLIRVEGWKLILICLLGAATTVVYFREVLRIARANGFGSGSWSTLMSIYRNASHFNSDDVESNASFLAATMYQLLRVASTILTYICANNFAIKGRKGIKILYVLPIIIYIICSLLTGGRMPLLKLFFSFIISYMLVSKRTKGWNKGYKTSSIVKIILVAVVVLVAFSQLRSLVGRTNQADLISYITMYAGGSIALLDLFIKDPLPPSGIWGKETFQPVYSFLGKRLHISQWVYISAKEFRRNNGVTIGNVYTGLRPFYYDFGFWGCILFCLIFGFFFSRWYLSLKRRNTKSAIDLKLVLYAYLSYAFVLFSINSYLDFISFNFLKQIVFFLAFRIFLCSVSFKTISND